MAWYLLGAAERFSRLYSFRYRIILFWQSCSGSMRHALVNTQGRADCTPVEDHIVDPPAVPAHHPA